MSDDTATVTCLAPRPRCSDALIAPSAYDARLLDVETAMFFFGKSPRVVMWWQLCTMGPAFEVVLPGYYAVRAIVGKPRRRGFFRCGFKSRLARDLAAMMGCRPRLDRVPVEDLSADLYRVVVETVGKDREQEAIPTGAQYSVVRRVLGVAER